MSALAWLGAALALLALGITLLNLLGWPRGRVGSATARVSVLVPARDEAENIASAVRAAAACDPAVHEILVYDDGSTDGTGAILGSLAAEIPRLRVLQGVPLPSGWVGKPHACHRLAAAAAGDVLLFVDADVRLRPDGVARLLSLLADHGAGVVTAVPHQRTGTFAERLMLPLLHVTYTSWLPLALVSRTADPRVLAANGQVIAFRRPVYATLGGFAAVHDQVVDDMAICRRAKAGGHRVVFADGERIATCRMYRSGRDLWAGFSKNLYEGLGGRPTRLLAVMALYALTFVVPCGALFAAALGAPVLAPALVGAGANLVQRAVLAVRHGHRAWSALLQPLAVLVLLALAVNSWRWSRRGAIRWRGRTYAPTGAPRG